MSTGCRTRAIFLYLLCSQLLADIMHTYKLYTSKYRVPGRLLTLQNVHSVLLIYSGPYLSEEKEQKILPILKV